jgi:hypothetical protein
MISPSRFQAAPKPNITIPTNTEIARNAAVSPIEPGAAGSPYLHSLDSEGSRGAVRPASLSATRRWPMRFHRGLTVALVAPWQCASEQDIDQTGHAIIALGHSGRHLLPDVADVVDPCCGSPPVAAARSTGASSPISPSAGPWSSSDQSTATSEQPVLTCSSAASQEPTAARVVGGTLTSHCRVCPEAATDVDHDGDASPQQFLLTRVERLSYRRPRQHTTRVSTPTAFPTGAHSMFAVVRHAATKQKVWELRLAIFRATRVWRIPAPAVIRQNKEAIPASATAPSGSACCSLLAVAKTASRAKKIAYAESHSGDHEVGDFYDSQVPRIRFTEAQSWHFSRYVSYSANGFRPRAGLCITRGMDRASSRSHLLRVGRSALPHVAGMATVTYEDLVRGSLVRLIAV